MPSNSFNSSPPASKPPAYCYYRKIPLPFVPPIGSSPSMQAYARWTDLDGIFDTDIALYIPLTRRAEDFYWAGSASIHGDLLAVTLERIAPPNNWTVQLTLTRAGQTPEQRGWTEVQLAYEQNWNSGMLDDTTIPGIDFRYCQITR